MTCRRAFLQALLAGLGIVLGACAPAPLVSGETRTLFLDARDGTRLVGTIYLPQSMPAPAVLLLHVANGSRREWDPWAKRLREVGYVALALDFRGHGDSGGVRDYPRMTADAAAAYDYLSRQPFVRADRIVVLGGSLGANVALAYAASELRLRGAALLSPGLGNYSYLAARDAARYGARPLLLLAGDGDAYAAATQRELAAIAGSDPQPQVLQAHLLHSARHGTALLNEPDAWKLLIAWLTELTK